jgi:hypothetical protein
LGIAEAASTLTPDVRRDARRGLAVYLPLVVVLSGITQAIWIINPEMGILVIPLMLSPAVASVIARLVLREGFSASPSGSGDSAPCRGTRLA